MTALKAQWAVVANQLMAGQADAFHTRAWSYTDEDFLADGRRKGDRFYAMKREADEYAAKLQGQGFNWVKTEYIWL